MCVGIMPAPWALLRPSSVCFALATAACLLIGGCSPGAEYPASVFPAIQDKPPQRGDTTMNQVEVQKATEDLINQRDRLNAQAPPSGPAQNAPAQNAQSNGPTPLTGDKAAKTATAAKKTVRKHAAQQAAAAPPATTASAQGAGTQAGGVQAVGTDLKP